MLYPKTLTFVAALVASVVATNNDKVYKYVVTFSVDGMHSSDVEKWVALKPESTIASLLQTGYEYTDCYTSAPSDSYPGVAAFVSGASPRTTGNELLFFNWCSQLRKKVSGTTMSGIAHSGLHTRCLVATALGRPVPKVL